MTIQEGDALAFGLDEAPGKASRVAKRRQQRRAEGVEYAFSLGWTPPYAHEQHSALSGILPEPGDAAGQEYFQRASACVDRGQYHLAVALLIRVVRRVDDHAMAWYRLGFAYGELGRYRQAIECYDKVIRIAPDWSEGWANRGWNRIRRNDDQGAIEDLLRAVEIDANSSAAWSHLGLAQSRVGRFDKAAESYERAVAVDPNNEFLCFGLAKCLATTGDNAGALRWLKRACELNPLFLRAWIALALRAPKKKDWPRHTRSRSVPPKPEAPSLSSLPNIGRVLMRETRPLNTTAPLSKDRLNRLWEFVQNPVSWILVFVLAALLYTLLGN